VHPEVVGNGARRLRRFNLCTPLWSGNFIFFPSRRRSGLKPALPPTTSGCTDRDRASSSFIDLAAENG